MIRTRMLFEAHILRGALRLTKQLIEASVYADLPGTEPRAAGETEPLRGARLAWGIPKTDESPYNTLSHAIRSIAGRWEMSPYWSDPACGGVLAWDLPQRACGQSASARNEDRVSVKEGQHEAIQLIDSAGIVLPEAALDGDATQGQVIVHHVGAYPAFRQEKDEKTRTIERDSFPAMGTLYPPKKCQFSQCLAAVS